MADSERIICSSADLRDSGDGVRFELEMEGRREPAFAVRYRGRVYAYLNRCAHMPMELDWKPGKFFDVWGLHLICSTHGATYAPDTGRCLRGPCFEEGLVAVPVEERGGSVIIYDEIRRLRGIYPNVPMYAVVEDICASGGYYIAAAADKIYVDKASIIGSIGVIMDGWGFTGTMEKLGVERRALTAGENKAFLDPFSPVDEKQKRHAQSMLDEIHKQSIDVVKKGRGKRLRESSDMFSGLLWTGARSIELGLSDGFGSVDFVAREVIKAEDIFDYTKKQDFTERFAKRFGAVMAGALAKVLTQGQVNIR